MSDIAMIGGGHLGYALAITLARVDDGKVFLYDIDESVIKGLQENREHPYFHRHIERPANIIPSSDISEVLQEAEIVFMAVPAQKMRTAVQSIASVIPKQAIIVNVAKAIERETEQRMSQIIETLLPDQTIATLSGGMLADELVQNKPVGANIASRDTGALNKLAQLFEPTTVRIRTTTDIVGIEYAGALKNVLAIGGGIVDGLGWGTSSKAFFVINALREVEALAVQLGAQPETFHTSSPAWMGDLMTTAFGNSRNRYLGELIGKGASRQEAEQQLHQEQKHAEGVITLKVVRQMIEKYDTQAPFLITLYSIVYNGANAKSRLTELSRL